HAQPLLKLRRERTCELRPVAAGIRRRRRRREVLQQLKEAPGGGRVELLGTEGGAGKWGFHKRYALPKRLERKLQHHPNGLDKTRSKQRFLPRRRAGALVNGIIVRCIQ